MPLIFMVSTLQFLIPPERIFPHLVWPPKVWLILNPINDPMHQFFEGYIHLSLLWPWFLNPQILSRPRRQADMLGMIYDWGLALVL